MQNISIEDAWTKISAHTHTQIPHPKNPWTLQWKGLNLHSRGLYVLKIAIFEGSNDP